MLVYCPRTSVLRWPVACLIAAALLAACSPQPAAPPAADTVAELAPSPVVNATGVVTPARWAALGMKTAGIAGQVLVGEGDAVEVGQPLVRLAGGDPENPSPDLEAAIRARTLEVASAERDLENLGQAAEQAKVRAQQAIAAAAAQVQALLFQLNDLDVPEDQQDLAVLDAFDAAGAAYREAFDAYLPFRDETGTEAREREEDLNQAKQDYETAARRVQLSLSLEAARADLDRAREDLAAYQDGPLPGDVDLAQKRLDSARAALAAAQAAPGSLTLAAPFAGTASEVLVRGGEAVSPGAPVVILADLSQLQVETTDLNEVDAARIRTGDRAIITFDALPDVSLDATVVSIASRASPGAGVSYKVVLELAAIPPDLRWGMSAFVDILPER